MSSMASRGPPAGTQARSRGAQGRVRRSARAPASVRPGPPGPWPSGCPDGAVSHWSWGPVRSPTGSGMKVRFFRSVRIRDKNPITPPADASIPGAVQPSIPAVLAPLFDRTRRHATARNAGSATRSCAGHRTRGPHQPRPSRETWTEHAPARLAASCGSGHSTRPAASAALPTPRFPGVSPTRFLSCSHRLTAVLPHVGGACRPLGVLRPLRPTRTPWADSAPAHYGRFVNRPHRAGPEWFPCSLRSGPGGRDPAIPRRSPRRPPTCAVVCSQRLDAARSGGLLIETARPAPHSSPPSTRFETVLANEASDTGSSCIPS